jgi:hypothetical protein
MGLGSREGRLHSSLHLRGDSMMVFARRRWSRINRGHVFVLSGSSPGMRFRRRRAAGVGKGGISRAIGRVGGDSGALYASEARNRAALERNTWKCPGAAHPGEWMPMLTVDKVMMGSVNPARG